MLRIAVGMFTFHAKPAFINLDIIQKSGRLDKSSHGENTL